MIFTNLIVKKHDDNHIKLINVSDGDEAIINENYIYILNSVIMKSCWDKCTKEENILLKELEDTMGIIVDEGVGNHSLRNGDLDSLDISLTNKCNLVCKHCYFYKNNKKPEESYINFDLLKNTLIEAKKIGLYKILLSGGEPFTYYRISALLKLVNDIGIHAIIISNGLLVEKYLKDIKDSNLSFIISLDGFKQSHEYLRGQNTYDKTVENLIKLIDMGFDVEVNMVVHKSNNDEIDEFALFLKNLGVSQLNLQVLRSAGRASQNLKDRLITDVHFLRRNHRNELKEQIDKIGNGTFFCKAFTNELQIDCKGNVFGCDFLSDRPISNIAKKTITEIYEIGLSENPIKKIKFSDTECSQCNLYDRLCAGGCRARVKKTTGSINGCDFWIPFLLNHPKFNESRMQPHELLFI